MNSAAMPEVKRYRDRYRLEGGDALQGGDGGVDRREYQMLPYSAGEEVHGVASVFEDEGGGSGDGDRAGTVLSVEVPPA